MYYLKIPVESEKVGIKIAEDHYGVMYWKTMPDGSAEAYPYESNPISVKAIKENQKQCDKCVAWAGVSDYIYCPDCGLVLNK